MYCGTGEAAKGDALAGDLDLPPVETFSEPVAMQGQGERWQADAVSREGPEGLGSPQTFASELVRQAEQQAADAQMRDMPFLWPGMPVLLIGESPPPRRQLASLSGIQSGSSPWNDDFVATGARTSLLSSLVGGPNLDGMQFSPMPALAARPRVPSIPSDSDAEMDEA